MPVSGHGLGHGVAATPEDEDLVDRMLNKSGCAEMHYKVQECIAEHKDWRKCQDVVKDFRNCINSYEQRKQTKS